VSDVLTDSRQHVYVVGVPMEEDMWRLRVKLRSRRLLRDYVKHMNLSVRQLSKRATAASLADGGPAVGPAIVGHLLSGKRKTCNPATARAIEEGLGCPPGLLFEASVSVVGRNTRQAVA
jgi:hypothetical protein